MDFGSAPMTPLSGKELPKQLKGVVDVQKGADTRSIDMSTHNVFGKFDKTNQNHVNAVGAAARGPVMPGGDANPRWDSRLKDLIVHEGGYFSTPKEAPKADVAKVDKPTVSETKAKENPIKQAAAPKKIETKPAAPAAPSKPAREMLKPGQMPSGTKPKSTRKKYWQA
jgi:hypothetical protein